MFRIETGLVDRLLQKYQRQFGRAAFFVFFIIHFITGKLFITIIKNDLRFYQRFVNIDLYLTYIH